MQVTFSENGNFASFRLEAAKKTSFYILARIDCHCPCPVTVIRDIPNPTPHRGYHMVTKDAKNSNRTKMAGNGIVCTSAYPTLPSQTP